MAANCKGKRGKIRSRMELPPGYVFDVKNKKWMHEKSFNEIQHKEYLNRLGTSGRKSHFKRIQQLNAIARRHKRRKAARRSRRINRRRAA